MELRIVNKVILVKEMNCVNCETKIEKALAKLSGVIEIKASFADSNVSVKYDENAISLSEIENAIEKTGYRLKDKTSSSIKDAEFNNIITINQLLGLGVIILASYIIIKNTVGFNFIPQVSRDMGYGILFIVGLLTSLHCIAMCGGISLSQCILYNVSDGDSKLLKFKPSFLYNTGRIISYTIIGGVIGALGSIISFPGGAKGIVAIIAGAFMMIMGINMLNIFPKMGKLIPKMPKVFAKKISNVSHRPFYVGLLNGLMPCGPLQAMQLYVLGTGSAVEGALSMFLFGLGTMPLMFGFGAISSLTSRKFTQQMFKCSAVLVMILGIIMLNRGLSLSGFSFLQFNSQNSSNVAKIQDNIQTVTTSVKPGKYTPIIVQKGIPVKWTIKAVKNDLNNCNNQMIVPQYSIEKKLVPGDNLIEFTPEEVGNITYTCWMGMIRSNINVVDNIANISQEDIEKQDNSINKISGESGCSCCNGQTSND